MDLKKVGIIAGKFKPPHKGHFETISKIASENDDISVFVSPVEMDGITGNAAVKYLSIFLKISLMLEFIWLMIHRLEKLLYMLAS